MAIDTLNFLISELRDTRSYLIPHTVNTYKSLPPEYRAIVRPYFREWFDELPSALDLRESVVDMAELWEGRISTRLIHTLDRITPLDWTSETWRDFARAAATQPRHSHGDRLVMEVRMVLQAPIAITVDRDGFITWTVGQSYYPVEWANSVARDLMDSATRDGVGTGWCGLRAILTALGQEIDDEDYIHEMYDSQEYQNACYAAQLEWAIEVLNGAHPTFSAPYSAAWNALDESRGERALVRELITAVQENGTMDESDENGTVYVSASLPDRIKVELIREWWGDDTSEDAQSALDHFNQFA